MYNVAGTKCNLISQNQLDFKLLSMMYDSLSQIHTT